MVIEYRWYQTEAIEHTYEFLRKRTDNPCIVIPTAGGKTPVIAAMVRDAVVAWYGRVLVVSHVKELVQQSADKIQALCPALKVGVYSAAMKRRDTADSIIVASIQSVYDKADDLGRFDLVFVDEAHLIPPSGDGMYQQLIAGLVAINADLRVIGLTATPYRLSSGPICTPDGILNEICYEVGVRPLINQGFLCRLIGKAGVQSIDSTALKVVRGEFDDKQTEAAFQTIIETATQEIIEKTLGRKSVLIFCQSVEHARRVAEILRDKQRGIFEKGGEELGPARSLFDLPADPVPSAVTRIAADYLEENGQPVANLRFCLDNLYSVGEVYGHTKADERDEIIQAFRAGVIKYLVNVNVLTTGFDAPNVDAVCLLRATVSPGLYYQMLGRGFRIHPDKENCLVLDFGENIKRHGPVDELRVKKKKSEANEQPGKVCPACRTVVGAATYACPDCGFAFDRPDAGGTNLSGHADTEEPISQPAKVEVRPVAKVTYHVHTKKGAEPGAPKTLRVTYHLDLATAVSEWVCVEHPAGGFAHRKAQRWWAARCRHPMPATAVQAVQFAQHGLLAAATAITTRLKAGERFPEISDHVLGEKPRGAAPCPECRTHNKRVILANDNGRFPGKIVCGWCGHFFELADQDTVNHYGIYAGSDGDYDGYLGLLGMKVDADQSLIDDDLAGYEQRPDDLSGDDIPW